MQQENLIFRKQQMQHHRRIAVCVYTTNAAQTIRAVEISKAILLLGQNTCKPINEITENDKIVEKISSTNSNTDDFSNLTLRFFTYRGCLPGHSKRKVDYEHCIREAGFEIEYFGRVERGNYTKAFLSGNSDRNENPTVNSTCKQNYFSAAVLDDEMWSAFLLAERTHQGLFPPPYDIRAADYLQAIIKTLSDFNPNVVLFGLFPEVAVASKIRGWKTVSFAPMPIYCRDWMKKRISANPKEITTKKNGNPWEVLEKAGKECGLNVPPSSNFIESIRPSHTIVCDFERFYRNDALPPDVTVVGPVISSSPTNQVSITNDIYPTLAYPTKSLTEIEMFLQRECPIVTDGHQLSTKREPPIRVFLTMGSTGDSKYFVEALGAIVYSKPGTFQAIVSVPSVLHDSNDVNSILAAASSSNGIFIERNFVPALSIMKHVDVVLCHGGQSTLQSAIAAGTPIVGTFNQTEQRFNLKNVEKLQLGICIDPENWKENAIRDALLKVGRYHSESYSCSNPYKESAMKMKLDFEAKKRSALEQAAKIVLRFAFS